MFREPADQPPQPGGVKNPALFWTLLAGMLILLALVVPAEWTTTFSGLLGEEQNPQVQAWSDPVDRADKRLRAGETLDISDSELHDLRPHLQVRRLYQVGPLNVEDARDAEAIFRDFNARIAAQQLEGSKDALRNERNKQLAEALPRLDRDEIDVALTTLREQLDTSASR